MKHALVVTALLMATLPVAGCREQASAPAPSAPAPTLPAGLFAAAAPADAKPLSAARAGAKPGDTVTFSGYIGGRAQPFTQGRAVFLVADIEKAPPCDDGCREPWDACCTPPEDIAAHSATVQVVDAQGAPLKLSLDGQGGMKKGALVTVTGKVREAGGSVFIVDAAGISVRTP